ncbi:YbaL family putative K(+) efflux transporter [Nitrospirillum pindoramense]|uniref:Kef-type potassium/proton antiporter (CPA2 family) n=1 Tax=Nitrospirillum amazonense TaxID=28077 RepID=A0A560HB12_9PROT|nr:YbaL family putative K(+) efflux transporter [Nitrospirillum amazonense]TWB42690.1 Kef-type potassium/proton antiporter (CPA2 family) [Nitrospirillum amazonense]
MMHETPLIATIVGGLGCAFVLGAIATRLRISPLVGYLLAGVILGPFTPGFVADQHLAPQLAEIGVILLMFGVGLHFSLSDLMSVKLIAIPGALAQIGVATLMGMGLAHLMGWGLGAGLVFGLALSVASTVVLLRTLQERRLMETQGGKIAIGWLVVEDMAMVLALVLLPALGDLLGGMGTPSMSQLGLTLAVTLGKVAVFVALMLVGGRRLIPWVLHRVAQTGSRELFRLAVLAVALGVAFGAAELFGVSFALGAFFAGMTLAESPLAHEAAEESLPLRDAFAVLFFVSVGMLFDWHIIIQHPLPLLGTLAIILVGKVAAAYGLVRAFRHSESTALTIAGGLAQIGEFSFILAAFGVDLGLLPPTGQSLILAGAILSILLNPVVFIGLQRLATLRQRKGTVPGTAEVAAAPAKVKVFTAPEPTALDEHAIIIGYGRVGRLVGEALRQDGTPVLVVEEDTGILEQLRASGQEVIAGNAAQPDVLAAANVEGARWLFVAVPNSFEAGQVVAQARKRNPHLDIIARAHTDAAVDHLRQHGASLVIMGEREIAQAMLAHTHGLRIPDPAPAREPPPDGAMAEAV